MYNMGTVLTVRTGDQLRQALEQRATAQGKTTSQLVREILERALAETPLALRAGHLRGCLDAPPEAEDAWRKEIRERNWRA